MFLDNPRPISRPVSLRAGVAVALGASTALFAMPVVAEVAIRLLDLVSMPALILSVGISAAAVSLVALLSARG